MKNRYGMVVVAGLALVLGTGTADVIAAGQHFGTVERKGASTSTKAGGKQCVIVLTQSKMKGRCELGADDPPAKINVGDSVTHEVLYVSDTLAYWSDQQAIINSGSLVDLNRKAAAQFLDNEKLPANAFWEAKVIVGDSDIPPLPNDIDVPELDPAPGETKRWTVKNVYTHEELKQAKEAAIKWAETYLRSTGGVRLDK